jgi:prepilin-type N-terminal cleavage/methylation domain-containing protein
MIRRTQSAMPSGRQKGFTLIEVMVTLGLLAIVMMGLQSLLATSIRAAATASTMTTATTLAQQKIELLRNTPYSDVELTSGRSESVLFYTRSWVVAAGPVTNTKNVTVSVAWSTPDGQRTVQLNTMLTN